MSEEVLASASTTAIQGAPTEALVPLFEPIFAKESTQAKRVVTGESTPIPAKIPTPQKGVTPVGASQTESSCYSSYHIYQ